MPSTLQELERALDTIQKILPRLPSLTKAMRISNCYGKKLPDSIEYQIPLGIKYIRERIKTLRYTMKEREKYRKILIPGKIYEIVFCNTKAPYVAYAEVGDRIMYLIKVIRYNKHSIKVDVLASDKPYFTSPHHDREFIFQLIPLEKGSHGWIYCDYTLDDAKKIKEVSPLDLCLYVGQHNTVAYEQLIKGVSTCPRKESKEPSLQSGKMV